MILTNQQFKSFKNVLITRAYYSSALNSLSNELLLDAPYNIFTTLYDSGDYLKYSPKELFKSERITLFMHNIDNLLLWFGICTFCIGISLIENKYKNIKSIENLYHFIDYKKIRKQTTQFIFILSFILSRNVSNAI